MCAYNPGVQDISGQLRAQGRLAQSTAITGGIDNAVNEYTKNKFLTGQAIAKFEGAVKADPDILNYLQGDTAPTAAGSALTKLHRDGAVGLKDASVLAQFAESYSNQKKEKQDREARQQQAQLYQQQAAQYAQMTQMKQQEEADRVAARRALAAAINGGGGIQPSPQAQPPSAPVSQYEQFVNDMGGNRGPAAGPPPRPAPPDAGEVMRRYMASGAPLTPDVHQALQSMSMDEGRRLRDDSVRDIAELRATTREQVENAKRENEKLRQTAKDAPPTFHIDPNTGLSVMIHGGVAMPMPGQVARDPVMQQIDAMVKSGDYTPAEATAARKKYIENKSTKAPTLLDQMDEMERRRKNGGKAAPAETPSGPPVPSTPADLLSAVKSGAITAADAKALAIRNGWDK